MEISIHDFYKDLFESFEYNKSKIDEQITRDFNRLTFYFHQKQINSKENFYYLLNYLPYSRLIKSLLWILPTQVTLFPFYFFFHNKYCNKIIAELSNDCGISNEFIIKIEPLNDKQLQVNMSKNLRIVENKNFVLHEIGYILMEIQFILGNQLDTNIQMKYKFVQSRCKTI